MSTFSFADFMKASSGRVGVGEHRHQRGLFRGHTRGLFMATDNPGKDNVEINAGDATHWWTLTDLHHFVRDALVSCAARTRSCGKRRLVRAADFFATENVPRPN